MTIYDAFQTMSTGTLPVGGAVVLTGGPVDIPKADMCMGPIWVKNTSGAPVTLTASAGDSNTIDGAATMQLQDGISVMLKSDKNLAWVSF